MLFKLLSLTQSLQTFPKNSKLFSPDLDEKEKILADTQLSFRSA
jgi:hypothetical protein